MTARQVIFEGADFQMESTISESEMSSEEFPELNEELCILENLENEELMMKKRRNGWRNDPLAEFDHPDCDRSTNKESSLSHKLLTSSKPTTDGSTGHAVGTHAQQTRDSRNVAETNSTSEVEHKYMEACQEPNLMDTETLPVVLEKGVEKTCKGRKTKTGSSKLEALLLEAVSYVHQGPDTQKLWMHRRKLRGPVRDVECQGDSLPSHFSGKVKTLQILMEESAPGRKDKRGECQNKGYQAAVDKKGANLGRLSPVVTSQSLPRMAENTTVRGRKKKGRGNRGRDKAANGGMSELKPPPELLPPELPTERSKTSREVLSGAVEELPKFKKKPDDMENPRKQSRLQKKAIKPDSESINLAPLHTKFYESIDLLSTDDGMWDLPITECSKHTQSDEQYSVAAKEASSQDLNENVAVVNGPVSVLEHRPASQTSDEASKRKRSSRKSGPKSRQPIRRSTRTFNPALTISLPIQVENAFPNESTVAENLEIHFSSRLKGVFETLERNFPANLSNEILFEGTKSSISEVMNCRERPPNRQKKMTNSGAHGEKEQVVDVDLLVKPQSMEDISPDFSIEPLFDVNLELESFHEQHMVNKGLRNNLFGVEECELPEASKIPKMVVEPQGSTKSTVENHLTTERSEENIESKKGVQLWLDKLSLGGYWNVFRKNEIDEEVLPFIKMNDLKAMGIEAVGTRRKMLVSIQELRASRNCSSTQQ